VSQAQSALNDAGLSLGSQLPESSSTVDSGLVTRSDPASGDPVEPNSAVDVYVSTGPEQVTVPDVSTGCLSVGAARGMLKDIGLLMEVGEKQPSIPDCPNGARIVAQDTAAGSTVDAGFTIVVHQGGGV
jgi:beta-lactam-binding protein with PASTA domain